MPLQTLTVRARRCRCTCTWAWTSRTQPRRTTPTPLLPSTSWSYTPPPPCCLLRQRKRRCIQLQTHDVGASTRILACAEYLAPALNSRDPHAVVHDKRRAQDGLHVVRAKVPLGAVRGGERRAAAPARGPTGQPRPKGCTPHSAPSLHLASPRLGSAPRSGNRGRLMQKVPKYRVCSRNYRVWALAAPDFLPNTCSLAHSVVFASTACAMFLGP